MLHLEHFKLKEVSKTAVGKVCREEFTGEFVISSLNCLSFVGEIWAVTRDQLQLAHLLLLLFSSLRWLRWGRLIEEGKAIKKRQRQTVNHKFAESMPRLIYLTHYTNMPGFLAQNDRGWKEQYTPHSFSRCSTRAGRRAQCLQLVTWFDGYGSSGSRVEWHKQRKKGLFTKTSSDSPHWEQQAVFGGVAGNTTSGYLWLRQLCFSFFTVPAAKGELNPHIL